MKTILKKGPTELDDLRKTDTGDENENKMRLDLVNAIDKCLTFDFNHRPIAKDLQQYEFFKEPRIFDIDITELKSRSDQGTKTLNKVLIKLTLTSEQSVSRKIAHGYEQKGK